MEKEILKKIKELEENYQKALEQFENAKKQVILIEGAILGLKELNKDCEKESV